MQKMDIYIKFIEMKKTFITMSLMTLTITSFAQKIVYVHDTVYVAKDALNKQAETCTVEAEATSKNNWGAKLKSSNFHLGLDLQTKYMWRGMEMMADESSPVVFPGINYQWKGLYAYAMGGYAINGKYAEVDLGVSYTWKGLTLGLSDYYYPTVNGKDDEYVGGKHNGHWLEACITYAPEKVPLWITVSNFFAGDDDVYDDDSGNKKQAYSTYMEVGTYYDFLDNNRLSLAVGMTPNKSCYTNYQKKFAVCNLDLKYTYNVQFKNGWTLPLSAEYIYNPSFDKSYVNFIANFAF